jgi:4-hydroxy-tetrahydrodipicolinate synthase
LRLLAQRKDYFMKKPIFTGSAVAIVTPFDKNGNVNAEKLGELIEYQIANKTDAIVICGTTGESSTLTDEEHKFAIEYTIKKVAGRIPVIAGTGSNDTNYGIELSVHAANAGADGLLLVTPYYNKTTQKGLIKHFNAIADAAKKPCIIYNVPSRTGMNVNPETYAELAKSDYIVACKEASSNISAIAQTAHLCGDNLVIYSGNDDQIIPILSLGGKGVISVLANVLPRETHEICENFFKGDLKKSLELQLKLLEFTNNLFIEVNPIPVKAAMNLLEFDVGETRLPLCDMSEKNLETLKSSMLKLGMKV